MKFAGCFNSANAILVARTGAPGHTDLSQHEAVLDALGDLGIPIIADVERGHVPPHLPIVSELRPADLVRTVDASYADDGLKHSRSR
jgi:muramoyltetrapeptide carboxypeptidase LdcA involved in peptidoglycan recycling